MPTYKFLADTSRCIKCTGCEAACKQYNEVPYGLRRIKVVTLNEGKPGETNIPIACMHCGSPPCMGACPVEAIYKRIDGIVLVNKDKCIGCGYCLYACPFGAPQFEGTGIFGSKGKMDKCTYCVQPYVQKDQSGLIEREPKPRCAAFCACKGILAGDAEEISAEMRKRRGARIPVTYIV
ncbi:MAG: 4Fe-4S dicluster domain-containing protein [Euryarchaeota archaeon]|nr:4Fe-4S dicluster domain-containing protein [Euryarchaeota archaeon]